jgi:hypothetical protein
MATPVKISRAYEEVIAFIASGASPSDIVAFQPSDAVKERVADLIYREKTEGLALEEKSELDHYMLLEHLMRLAKAHARQYLNPA